MVVTRWKIYHITKKKKNISEENFDLAFFRIWASVIGDKATTLRMELNIQNETEVLLKQSSSTLLQV